MGVNENSNDQKDVRGTNAVVQFDAEFECANCDHIRRINKQEFHVFMRSDSNALSSL